MGTLESRIKKCTILGIDAERVVNPSLSSRPWTRFRIKSVRSMTLAEIPSFLGPEFDIEEFFAKVGPTLVYHEQRNRPDEGKFVGTYLLRGVYETVRLLECTQVPLCAVPTVDVLAGKVPMNSVIGVPTSSTESTSSSPRRQTWEQDLIAKVERICGRAYIEDAP
ncbi:hypothetical protein CERSUDRAFT_96496 [Gelatoporia subvermispora B]|uniref:Uncharacterized protein n=1 Tax=Ceriporiopsis subvermispora (strain B) TaxID=914234 RepID=M2QTK2_CERS8|nr:hypothetical protein CERSUDRAFT_96496 [Gelatoporia subvermispora B]